MKGGSIISIFRCRNRDIENLDALPEMAGLGSDGLRIGTWTSGFRIHACTCYVLCNYRAAELAEGFLQVSSHVPSSEMLSLFPI